MHNMNHITKGLQNTLSRLVYTPLSLWRGGGGEAFIALLLLASCADNHILPPEVGEGVEQTGIAFISSVQPSLTAVETRADGSLVNRLETQLLPTQERTYYLWDNTKQEVVEKQAQYYVGIYGAFTGNSLWKDMTSPKPTADFFYNQQATIGTDGKLSYEPERFWSNNVVDDAVIPSRRAYASFWAYYPWNATVSGVGDYGISITTDADGVTTGNGMGKVRFTMHPDAAEQNDFLISDLTADCSKDQYPLTDDGSGGWTPQRVPLRFHHMLAQVRLYAFIQGRDRVVYKDEDDDGEADVADATWFVAQSDNTTIVDDLGNIYKKTGAAEVTKLKPDGTSIGTMDKAAFVALGLKVPDETKTVRWWRNAAIRNLADDRYRAEIFYSMSFNNIHTQALYEPTITYDPGTGTYAMKANITTTDAAIGSATVRHYIMNPYWFRFYNGKRVMLNETYMYDYFEDTPAYKATTMTVAEIEQDGVDWSSKTSNCLGYTGKTGTDFATGNNTALEVLDRSGAYPTKHYNYPPGNILLVVPQQLTDDDVPNIVITATGYQANADGTKSDTPITAKVTINMLQMNLKWEAGFIYSYAFLDELMPGDDKVRGPETITVVFDPSRFTDQW